MYGNPYRPERLPQAAERTIGQESLRAALAIARSVHETDQAHQQTEPTNQDERWELNAQLRLTEIASLHIWAEGNDLLLDATDFTRKWLAFGEIEGGEHQVYQKGG